MSASTDTPLSVADLERELHRVRLENRTWRVAILSSGTTVLLAALGLWVTKAPPAPAASPTPVQVLSPPIASPMVLVRPPAPIAPPLPVGLPPDLPTERHTPHLAPVPLPFPPPQPNGALTIISTPKADTITVDSKEWGPGHIFNRPLRAGLHHVTVVSEACSKSFDVVVNSEITRDLRVDLHCAHSESF